MSQPLNSEASLNHKELSTIGLDFVRFATDNADFEKPLSVAQSGESLFAKQYQFSMHSMPVFVSNERSQQMGQNAVDLFNVYKDLVLAQAKVNPQLLDKYFESIGEKSVQQLLSEHHGLDYCLLRGDFINDEDGFKVMEFNVTGNIGGWGVGLFEKMYREYPAVKRFINDRDDINFTSHHPFQEMVNHVVATTFNFTQGRKPNIGVWLEQTTRLQQTNDMFGRVKKMLATKGFDVEFTALIDTSKLELVDDKLVTDNGAIDSLLLIGKPGTVPDFVHHQFEKGVFPIFNGRAAHILHQKSGLALLSEYADWPECSDEHKQLIDSSVPWTRLLDDVTVKYQGQQQPMVELVKTQKDDFVIKPVNGSQGNGVHVGNRTTQERWDELVDAALTDETHIIQGFCQSKKLLARDTEGDMLPHDAVWGPFVFGGKFAGHYLRLLPSGSETGVINAHRGASDAFVFLHD